MIRYVYVAGPLSADTAESVTANVVNAMRVGARLLDAGLTPIVPHLCVLWDKHFPRSYESWLAHDFALIERTDALLRIAPSPGTDREVAHAAARGIPVFFRVEDLLAEVTK